MALITMKEILQESVEKRYAVGAFDTFDHSMTEAILRGAEAVNRPVILMVVEPLFTAPHFEWFFKYLVQRCEESTVPVALHLDHGFTFEGVMKAIRYGCTSVMMDGSSLSYEENVALTKKVVDVAHACGVSVEAEIGHVAGHEGNMLEGNVADESAFTRVEDARRFADDTNVDALAIAFGTVHGVFKGEPKLDFERLKEIRKTVSIPLVMHGGSGLSPEAFRMAVDNGINKINFFTGLSLGGANTIIKMVEERRKKLQFGEIVNAGMDGISAIVQSQIEIFGTQPLSH